MDVETQLIYSTVRLQTETSVGTGFFYRMNVTENNDFKPVIVTNRHVLEGADKLTFTLRCKGPEGIEIKDFPISNLFGNVIFHPDKEIDLAVFPIPGIWDIARETWGLEPEVVFLDDSIVPNKTETADINAIEDVLVIGYPNGLWDSINVRPLARRGITASDFKIDYEGKPQFIIDCSIFPGSSGSPVFLYSKGTIDDGNGNFVLNGLRLKLLGINSSVFIQNLEGKLVESQMPTSLVMVSQMPIGLGIVIKANQLKEMESLLPD